MKCVSNGDLPAAQSLRLGLNQSCNFYEIKKAQIKKIVLSQCLISVRALLVTAFVSVHIEKN